MKGLYDTSSVDFEYVALVTSNSAVSSYVHNTYNIRFVPTVYSDGGFITAIGATSSQSYYNSIIQSSMTRPAHQIYLEVTFTWQPGAQLLVDYTVYSEELTNDAPTEPSLPDGPSNFPTIEEHSYSSTAVDPDGDDVYYRWAFGDGDSTEWLGPYTSGATCTVSHTWAVAGSYDVTVSARDKFDAISDWSDPLHVNTFDYTCGDADGNSIVNISDAVYLIAYIFGGGDAPNPVLAGDGDCNGIVNISDAVYLIAYIFGGGDAPCAVCP